MVAYKETNVIELGDSIDEVRKSILENQGYTIAEEIPQSVIDLQEQAEVERATTKAKVEIKSAILRAIDTMRVEVDGLGYDGDEVSTSRMVKAIQTLVGDEKITWKTYDNQVVEITQTELGKTLRASGILMTKLWYCTTVAEVEAIVGQDTIWLAKYKG